MQSSQLSSSRLLANEEESIYGYYGALRLLEPPEGSDFVILTSSVRFVGLLFPDDGYIRESLSHLGPPLIQNILWPRSADPQNFSDDQNGSVQCESRSFL